MIPLLTLWYVYYYLFYMIILNKHTLFGTRLSIKISKFYEDIQLPFGF
jgi:hypothetical protein